MDCILAIDMGTTNCKAVVFENEVKVISTLKKSYTTLSDADGKSEQNPDEVFSVVLQLIKESLAKNNNIVAVSFSAAMHSLIAVDAEGKPLTQAILWSDTRAARQAEELKENERSRRIYKATGTPIHPMSPLCKIIWLREEMPDIFTQTHKFISLKEYIFYQLFGKYIIDYSIASATGLFDIHQLQWCEEALEAAGIKAETLSTPVEATHSEQELLPLYQQQLQPAKPLRFIVGGNDGCLANLGSGIINRGDASLTIGTSGAVRMTTDKAIMGDEQSTFTYLLMRGIYITGGAINNGGITLEWLSGIITDDATPKDPDEVLALAQSISPGAEHLLFLPYLLGERAPMWDANAKGVLFGLQHHHTKAHIARASVEGICFALRDVMEAIEKTNGDIQTIYASGGFTQSSFWLQMLSDVLGKTIVLNNSADASATGAAIIGLHALSYLPSLSVANGMFSVNKTFLPDAAIHQTYTSLFAIFQSLYPILKDPFTKLSRL